jgi:serine/threonine protein kinase
MLGGVAVPELSTHMTDPTAFAWILRAALRTEEIELVLAKAPAGPGAHLLHVVLEGPDAKAVWVLAEVRGPAPGGRHTLRVQPRSRTQAAQLYALAQLASPSSPPDDDLPPPSVLAHSQAPVNDGTFPRRAGAAIRIELAPVPKELVDPLLGHLVSGKYRVDAKLGAGAAGVVYKGVHVELDRTVAIKILHADQRTNDSMVARFKAEARAASRLDHANITRVLDFGQERFGSEKDGLLYLVMEFVDGTTLENVLTAGGRLAPKRALDIAAQVCGALVRAHTEGVVHRDIKPENIMLVQEIGEELEPMEVVKVCDFGVAKLLDPGAAGLTLGPQLVGSPAYMSPEQARGETPDPRSDIYSLGVTLFEITTGRLPFDGTEVHEVIVKHVAEPPPRPSSIVPGYDPALEALLLRMLAKDRKDRPASARELRAEIRKIAAAL